MKLDLMRRIAALHAAAAAWAGIDVITDRDGAILKTAECFERWLLDADDADI